MDRDRTHGWKAFAAWVLCGTLWGLSWAGMFSVGPIILPLAVLLTVLLVKDGLSKRLRHIAWRGYLGWLFLYVAALFLLSPMARFLILVALLFLGLILRAGPAGWGLLTGLGAWGVLLGADWGVGWLAGGVGMIAASLVVFSFRRKTAQSIEPEDAAHTAG